MKAAPYISRRYDDTPDACADALKLLLNRRGKKNAGGTNAGEDAEKEIVDDSRRNTSLPKPL